MQDGGVFDAVWRALRRPVPADYRNGLAFGWMIMVLFSFQVVSGSLLSFYYQPSSEVAADSVEFIMRDVHWGWLIRGSHYWASIGMVVFGIAQAVKVLVTGVYRARPGNWYLGWLLMLLVLAFVFTGELLTWDQEAYWTVTTSLERLATVPVIGGLLSLALRGGNEVGPATLSRIYSVHIMFLPWITFFLVVLNVWLIAQTRSDRRRAS